VRVVCARGGGKAAVEQLNVSTEIQSLSRIREGSAFQAVTYGASALRGKNGFGRSEALGRQRGSSVACNANPCMSMAFK
jgi:hypothetical protein